MANQNLLDELNKQLANWNILYTKLHNYHWYVTGSDFFTLHEKFEDFYGEAAQYIDEIAERILTIKGKPIATLKEYLEHASLEEAAGKEEPKEMVAAVADDFNKVVKEASVIIELAGEAGDDATEDMFIGMRESLEKHMWMLNAYLNR